MGEAKSQVRKSKPQPCPWCHATARVELLGGDHEGPPYWVGCIDPKCEASGPVHDVEADAVSAWNRIRLEPAP